MGTTRMTFDVVRLAEFELIEIYIKSDRENEDRSRIRGYYSEDEG